MYENFGLMLNKASGQHGSILDIRLADKTVFRIDVDGTVWCKDPTGDGNLVRAETDKNLALALSHAIVAVTNTQLLLNNKVTEHQSSLVP